ncbi:hypothetical protein SAMN05421734_10417 [Pelagirhabdus alkalitolerans]|uniref:RNA-binding protein KhpB N-terminal domain-containing protein n=1 Tax=Pelagirhabdus alkalitolerans TaxID=1612202 RepID=A0A1G6IFD9_9BACI|nr:FapA family protein [Pelagirhabdus alkalitolerans]SDC05239.1 hypothetical protein SAMN05421734_10417 [Pelagirhabdus alkalitolerans]
MQTFISKGSTVKEAISVGLETLNLNIEQVHIEVIQSEKKGVFGIGSKDAIVKLTREQVEKPTSPNPTVTAPSKDSQKQERSLSLDEFLDTYEAEVETTQDDVIIDDVKNNEPNEIDDGESYASKSLEGKVWVQNGRVYVRDSDKHQPSIQVSKGVKLKKNSKIVEDTFIFISENDQLEFELLEEKRPTKWSVKLTENDLQAILTIYPGVLIKRQVKDVAPSYQITVDTIEKTELHQSITAKDVLDYLEEIGVVYGIDHNKINEALLSDEGGDFVIAEGKKPTEPIDGSVEKIVETDVLDFLKASEDEHQIDYRERKQIPTVEQGQVIAIIHPAFEGLKGTSIKGEVIEPRKPKEINVKTQKGTILLDDKVVANENGRPFIEQRDQFVKTKVLQQMVHEGNVDMESGNIHFQGDIRITGQVTENMTISSGGSVLINDTVNGAVIHASKSIQIYGSVNASDVSAGGEVNVELQHALKTLHTQSDQLYRLIEQIVQSESFKQSQFSDASVSSLVTMLKEKRFNNLMSNVRTFIKLVDQEEKFLADEEWKKVAKDLKEVYLKIPSRYVTLDFLKNLVEQMEGLKQLTDLQNDAEAEISLKNSLNSRLISAGDITITGKSCVNTDIQAEGAVYIKGVARGGRIEALGGADLNEVGGKMGTKTFVTVPEDEKIRIGKAMEGTIIRVGDQQHAFERDESMIHARLNKDGRLTLR